MQSVSSQKDNWSEARTGPLSPRLQATEPASQPSDANSSQVPTALLGAPGRPCNEEKHCSPPGNFGKVPESWAGLCGSLYSGVVTAVSWSPPAGSDLIALLRLITWLPSSVLTFLQVLQLPCASWREVMYLVGWQPWHSKGRSFDVPSSMGTVHKTQPFLHQLWLRLGR